MEISKDIQQQVLSYETKSLTQWFIDVFIVWFPLLLGLFVLLGYNFGDIAYHFPKRTSIVELSIPFFFLFILVEIIVSKYLKKDYYRLNDAISSIFMGNFQVLLEVLCHLSSIGTYYYLNNRYALIDFAHYDGEYTWMQWILVFVLVDMSYYWFHRLAHEKNYGWSGHIVHHTSEEYNLSTALRQGFLQGVFSWMYYLPLAVFIPVNLFQFHKEFNTVYQFWIHTRLIDKFWWPIEYVFNTPSHHRVHHGRAPFKYIDKNYGGTLIIWDRLFGTFELEVEQVHYGISYKLDTWSIFWTQFHHLVEIKNTFTSTRGWWNKLRVIYDFGPLYNYKVLKYDEFKKWKESQVKNIGKEIKVRPRPKFDNTVSNNYMWWYILFHFILSMVFSFVFLKIQRDLDTIMKWIYCAYLMMHMNSLMSFFDQKYYSNYLETARLMWLSYILYTYRPVLDSSLGYGLQSINILSCIWIWLANRSTDHVKKE